MIQKTAEVRIFWMEIVITLLLSEAIEHPCHILDPINGGIMSSRHILKPPSSLNRTQTLLGSSAYRYHDLDPPIRNRSLLYETRHESANKNKRFVRVISKVQHCNNKYLWCVIEIKYHYLSHFSSLGAVTSYLI